MIEETKFLSTVTTSTDDRMDEYRIILIEKTGVGMCLEKSEALLFTLFFV
jgi:hypothetical protein